MNPVSWLSQLSHLNQMERRTDRLIRITVALGLALVLTLSLASGAAAASKPRWQLDVIPLPNHFVPSGEEPIYEVVLTNIGGAPSNSPIKMELQLPSGITVKSFKKEGVSATWTCAGEATSLATCETNEGIGWTGKVGVGVEILPLAATESTVTVTVSGGEAPLISRTITNEVTDEPSAFEITDWGASGRDDEGGPFVVAAGHPTLFNTLLTTPAVISPGEGFTGVESAKNIVVDLPLGVYGNPTAASSCPISVFFASLEPRCPASSQIGGFAVSGIGSTFGAQPQFETGRNPIYNLTPEPGYPVEFGFWDAGVGLGVVAQGQIVHTPQGYVVRVTVPSAAKGIYGPWYLQTSFFGNPDQMAGSPGPGRPFLTYPSDCDGQPLRATIHLDSWAKPAPLSYTPGGAPNFADANFSDPRWHTAVSESPPVSGCEGLHFGAGISVRPDTSSADSAAGLTVDLVVPQDEDAGGAATPPLRAATVALPRGLVVNPSSADGLAGCSEAHLAPDSTDPGSCPESSKIGTATLRTPLIDHPVEGSLYVGTPECAPCSNADAASGKLIKLYVEIDDPKTGVVVKLPGTVAADPDSGQLTATFTENPQLPFEELELHVKSGARAPLTTPSTCGEYTTTSDLAPWSAPQSGPDAKPQSRFSISSGPNGSSCPNGEGGLLNSPKFEAGTTAPLAGTYSPFVLKVSRENGSQRIGSLEATLPTGLLGTIAGIPYCSDAAIATAGSKGGREEQASPSCPLASEIGTVNVGAGSGNPFYVQGHAYLAGPYKGAPLSLEIITPAVAGPFDLGTVAVRTALYVNESTSQIHAVSDPIPSILAGIPLDVRSIALNLNRPEFTLNPTSCNAMTVLGATTSTLGQTAGLQNRFQVGGCKGLAFKPTLKLAFTGQTKRTGFPAVKAVLTQPKGHNANVAGVTVILPKGMLIANAHINNPCTRVQFNSGQLPGENCPAKSVLGTAKVWTPLLEKPEGGKVYFRSNGGERKLPDLAIALRGQIPLQLLGFIDSVGKKGAEVRQVRSRFLNLPDAPVSRFELKLAGGKKGLLQNSKNLCKSSDKATFNLTGQSGAIFDTEPKVHVACVRGGKREGKPKKAHRSK